MAISLLPVEGEVTLHRNYVFFSVFHSRSFWNLTALEIMLFNPLKFMVVRNLFAISWEFWMFSLRKKALKTPPPAGKNLSWIIISNANAMLARRCCCWVSHDVDIKVIWQRRCFTSTWWLVLFRIKYLREFRVLFFIICFFSSAEVQRHEIHIFLFKYLRGGWDLVEGKSLRLWKFSSIFFFTFSHAKHQIDDEVLIVPRDAHRRPSKIELLFPPLPPPAVESCKIA